MAAPQVVVELVSRFDRNVEAYLSGRYNETQLRREFLDPFFECLGWDVNNRAGHAEAYKDVIHEDAIKIGGATKAPDYCFCIGGTRKFFLEAKKPAVNIKQDVSPAYQLRRYAWSAKLQLSILSDFEEFAVYDSRLKPAITDKPSTGRIILLNYREYPDRWDEVAAIFSREAVLKGSFDKFADTAKGKRGTAEVDSEFLKDIESWRGELARNIAIRNTRLSQRELNFAVQRIIDRIIFLRIAEDRGIEDYGLLRDLQTGAGVYARLCQMFRRADERYNSGLFHFQSERGRSERPDELTLGLHIDDTLFKEIVRSLYFPESPYEFSVLPADILGQVYEQFLGKVIRLTAGHRAVVEDKPEVKKAGGVYYTPTYVVDFIIRQTVGLLLKDKAPRQVAKLKILDPACGSGSFLLGAYQYLLDWHRDWYIGDDPEKHQKEIYQGPGGSWRLTTTERKRILLANIHGVDIDPQAVETSKLSLLLKVLENETQDSLERQRRLFQVRALPDLGLNIQCGNSLIGPDFYVTQQMKLFDEDERYRINVFDWQAQYPVIMAGGGFDAVIGNPPWGAEFSEPELAYLRGAHRSVVARMIDSYLYFVDQAIMLAREGGPVGFIVPSTLLNQVDSKPVRELLLKRGLSSLVSLGQGIFGAKVLNTSTIFVSQGRGRTSQFILSDLANVSLRERRAALHDAAKAGWLEWEALVRRDPHQTFFVAELGTIALLDRLRRSHGTFAEVVAGEIQRGVSPDIVAAHVVSKREARSAKLERDLLRPSVSGRQFGRYRPWTSDQSIVYTTRATAIDGYPNAVAHLRKFRKQNTCKEVTQGKHPWWALHRPRDPEIFSSPKLIGVTTSKRIELLYDETSSLYVTDAMYVFRLVEGHDPWACMAILQSETFHFLYRMANQGESRVIPQIKASKLQTIPYPLRGRDDAAWSRLGRAAKELLGLHRELTLARTGHDRTTLERQIGVVDVSEHPNAARVEHLKSGHFG